MTILAFWSVDNIYVDRHLLDNVSSIDAFEILYYKRDELNARFYDLGTFSYSDPLSQDGILNAYDFEEDYNDEILDGGRWCKVITIDREDVERIVKE